MKDKFNWGPQDTVKPITNSSLKCQNCELRSSRTDICGKYPGCKPISILLGGDCIYYKKENTNGQAEET